MNVPWCQPLVDDWKLNWATVQGNNSTRGNHPGNGRIPIPEGGGDHRSLSTRFVV